MSYHNQMENPLLNTVSNSNISKNVNIKNNLSQTNTQLMNFSANLMPSERQTSFGVFNPGAVTKSNLDMQRFSSQRIYNPNGAPSAIASENFLSSKSLSAPIYTHNIAHTKYALVSSWSSEEPRFTKKVNILA